MIISVIIPMYNAESTIERLLLSIIKNSNEKYEIIIVDDGSSDNSYEICKEFIKNNKSLNINLYKKDNGGVSSARNFGISKAVGDYLIFCDSDDELAFKAIDYLIENAISNFDLTVFEVKKTKKNRSLNRNLLGIYKKSDLLKNFDIWLSSGILNSPCNKIYRTQLIKEKSILFDESMIMGEDLKFNLNYLEQINHVNVIDRPLYIYHVESSDLTTKYMNDYFKIRLLGVENIESFYNLNGLKKNMVYFLYIKLVFASLFMDFHNDSKIKQNDIKTRIKYMLKYPKVSEAISNYTLAKNFNDILYFVIKTKNKTIIYYFAILFYYVKNKFGNFFRLPSV